MNTLRGKTALVTGASRGIGVFIARAMAGEGMHLVLVARSAAALESVAAELRSRGTQVLTIPADVGQTKELEALVERADAESGGVDVLVNNAGLETAYPYDRVGPESIEQMIAVNLTAPMLLSRLLLRKMISRGAGHIVNIASMAGLAGVPYQETYCATKHGLVGFTRSLRLTASAEGYPVGGSVICPGFVSETGMYARESQESGVEAPPALGTSPPEEVARAVVRAVREDAPEIIVSSKPVRPLLLIQALAPRLATRVTQRIGISALFKGWSDHRVSTQSGTGTPNIGGGKHERGRAEPHRM